MGKTLHAKYQTEDPFTRIPNAAIRDEHLDLKALGLLVLMLSKPEGWSYTERNLATDAGVSRDQLRTAMRKLIDAGYVERDHVRDGSGRPVSRTKVADRPVFAQGRESQPSEEAPGSGIPRVGNPEGRESQPPSNEGFLVTNENCSNKTSDPSGTDIVLAGEDRSEPPTIDTPLSEAAREGWQEAKALCEHLAEAITESGGAGTKTPTVTRKWVQTMEQLVRLDERAPEQVRTAIDWAHRGPGQWWSDKVLSPDALRRHYEKMRRQAARDQGGGNGQQGNTTRNGYRVVTDMAAYGREIDEALAGLD